MSLKHSHNNLTERLQLANNIEDFTDCFERAARKIGFDHFAYGLKTSYPLTSPRTELVNNYPSQWQQTYADNQ